LVMLRISPISRADFPCATHAKTSRSRGVNLRRLVGAEGTKIRPLDSMKARARRPRRRSTEHHPQLAEQVVRHPRSEQGDTRRNRREVL
jgi:hypothetical protein